MWIYFDKQGRVRKILEHGTQAFVGSSDFEIFCVFEGQEASVSYPNATIKFEKPDFDNTEYPALAMTATTKTFTLNAENTETAESVSPFVNNRQYAGYLFDFSNFGVDSEDQVVDILLDTPGLWSAIVTLYNSGSKTYVRGTLTFNVNGSSTYTEQEIAVDTLLKNIYGALAQKLNINSNTYIKVIENADLPAIGNNFSAENFSMGMVLYNKDTKKFYKLGSSLTRSDTNPSEIEFDLESLIVNVLKVENLTLTGNLTDGTNTLTVAAIKNKADAFTVGNSLSMDNNREITVNTNVIQEKMTASDGVKIENGKNITINDAVVQRKLTAGTGIKIENNTIIATGSADLSAYRKAADQDEIDDEIRAIAEGKTASYVLSYEEEFSVDNWSSYAKPGYVSFESKEDLISYIGSALYFKNDAFNSNEDYIDLTIGPGQLANKTPFLVVENDYTGTNPLLSNLKIILKTSDLNKGDIILVTETDVPDRWYSKSKKFYKMETAKIDIDSYQKKEDMFKSLSLCAIWPTRTANGAQMDSYSEEYFDYSYVTTHLGVFNILHGGEKCSEYWAKVWLRKMTGYDNLPEYNSENPKYVYVIFKSAKEYSTGLAPKIGIGDTVIVKVRWDGEENGLRAYVMQVLSYNSKAEQKVIDDSLLKIAQEKAQVFELDTSITDDDIDYQNYEYYRKSDGTAFTSASDMETYLTNLICGNSQFDYQEDTLHIETGNDFYFVFEFDGAVQTIVRPSEYSSVFKKRDLIVTKDSQYPSRYLTTASDGVDYYWEALSVNLTSYRPAHVQDKIDKNNAKSITILTSEPGPTEDTIANYKKADGTAFTSLDEFNEYVSYNEEEGVLVNGLFNTTNKILDCDMDSGYIITSEMVVYRFYEDGEDVLRSYGLKSGDIVFCDDEGLDRRYDYEDGYFVAFNVPEPETVPLGTKNAENTNSIVVGTGSSDSATYYYNDVVIGPGAKNVGSGGYSIAIGKDAQTNTGGSDAIAIGRGAIAKGSSIAIGYSTFGSIDNTINFDSANAAHTDRTIVLADTSKIFFRNEKPNANYTSLASYTNGKTLASLMIPYTVKSTTIAIGPSHTLTNFTTNNLIIGSSIRAQYSYSTDNLAIGKDITIYGKKNTAIGLNLSYVGKSTEDSYNVVVGYGIHCGSAKQSVAIGAGTGISNMLNSVAIGYGAYSDYGSVSIGAGSYNNGGGTRCVAIGLDSAIYKSITGQAEVSCFDGVAIGSGAECCINKVVSFDSSKATLSHDVQQTSTYKFNGPVNRTIMLYGPENILFRNHNLSTSEKTIEQVKANGGKTLQDILDSQNLLIETLTGVTHRYQHNLIMRTDLGNVSLSLVNSSNDAITTLEEVIALIPVNSNYPASGTCAVVKEDGAIGYTVYAIQNYNGVLKPLCSSTTLTSAGGWGISTAGGTSINIASITDATIIDTIVQIF